MTDDKKRDPVYRAAVVGCGRVGGTFDDDPKRQGIWTHAGAYRAHHRTELVAAADIDPAALERFGKRWKVNRLYSDCSTLLDHEAIDVLSVCTPSDTHCEIVRTAARRGIRAIWCEKPMSRTVRQGAEMADACRERALAVNHTRRWDACYQRAKEWIAAGGLGEAVAITCWYTGGVSNIGSHLFDAIRFLFGDAESVWAHRPPGNAGDPNLGGVVELACGAPCAVVGCGTGDLLLFEIDAVGTRGRLRVRENGRALEAWQHRESHHYSGYREPDPLGLLHEGEDGNRMLTALTDILACLEGGGHPLSSGADGIKAVEMVAAFLLAGQRGETVKLPLAGNDLDFQIPVR